MADNSPQDIRRRRNKVATVCRRLDKLYGPVVPPEQGPVLDELIATILSQNTSNRNSKPAFAELCRRFDDWDAVRRGRVARIARAIHRAGLSNTKAPRIKAILQQLHQQRGELSLEFLHQMPPREAEAWLRSLPGVGPKTAACVLLFACRMPILPVDTHVHRLARHLGLIGPRIDAERAHDELARLVPPRLVLDFHIQLIRHGRTLCKARNPKCDACPLLDICLEGRRRVSFV